MANLSYRLLCVVSILAPGHLILGQAPITLTATAPESGIVVESVAKGSQAEQLGVRAGDCLMSWRLGDTKGKINSPFDLPFLRFEYAARGSVTVYGVRGAKNRAWHFGSDIWGIVARPALPKGLLSLYNEGAEFLASGQPVRAAKHWQAADSLARQQGPSWLAPWFLSRAAQALFRAKEWNLVDAVYEQAIREANTDSMARGELLRQRASGFEYRGDLANASKYYQELLVEWGKLNTKTMMVANSLVLLANVELQRFEFADAEAHLQQASAITYDLAPTSVAMVTIFDDLGVLFEERVNFDKAEGYYRRALAIEEKCRPASFQVANILKNLGTMLQRQGNLRRAEAYYRRALVIAEKRVLNKLELAEILSDLGECVLERGQRAEAEAYQRHSLLLRQQVEPNSPLTASSLASLGKIARINGDLEKAEQYYQQASAMAARVQAPAADIAKFLVGRAEVQRDRKDFRNAEDLFREGIQILDRVMPGSIARAEAMGDLAGIVRQEKRLEDAAQLYQAALEALASTARLAAYGEQRSRYRAFDSHFYQEYADVLVELGKQTLGFETVDGSRARTLREMLLETHVDIRNGADHFLLDRRRQLQTMIRAKWRSREQWARDTHRDQQLSPPGAEIEELVAQYEQVSAQLRTDSPNYAALTEPKTLAAAQIQEFLDNDTILLEYSLGDEHSFVWAVTDSSLAVYELPKRIDIERAARRVYAALTRGREGIKSDLAIDGISMIASRPGTNYQLVGTQLSRMILSPVASLLEHKRLVIVPDGALTSVPFAALPSLNDARLPLIAEHEVVSLPSASILAELRRAQAAHQWTREVAVLADPVFDPADERVTEGVPAGSREALGRATQTGRWSEGTSALSDQLTRSASDIGLRRNGGVYLRRLIHTRQEAEAIMAVTPRAKVMKAIDFRATRDMAMNPMLGQYRIVHFATHGLVDSKHPELSGLVFSLVNEQGKPRDGFLSLEDIYNLQLPVDLVVLSACETGLGEQISGEGLIGLTRGFMYAGASRVVASLWAVNDTATAELMSRFYKAMEVDGMRPAAALREAQLAMWKQRIWHSPYYWAGFQIQGEWK